MELKRKGLIINDGLEVTDKLYVTSNSTTINNRLVAKPDVVFTNGSTELDANRYKLGGTYQGSDRGSLSISSDSNNGINLRGWINPRPDINGWNMSFVSHANMNSDLSKVVSNNPTRAMMQFVVIGDRWETETGAWLGNHVIRNAPLFGFHQHSNNGESGYQMAIWNDSVKVYSDFIVGNRNSNQTKYFEVTSDATVINNELKVKSINVNVDSIYNAWEGKIVPPITTTTLQGLTTTGHTLNLFEDSKSSFDRRGWENGGILETYVMRPIADSNIRGMSTTYYVDTSFIRISANQLTLAINNRNFRIENITETGGFAFGSNNLATTKSLFPNQILESISLVDNQLTNVTPIATTNFVTNINKKGTTISILTTEEFNAIKSDFGGKVPNGFTFWHDSNGDGDGNSFVTYDGLEFKTISMTTFSELSPD
jgi:hypothetical protein